MQKNNDNSVTLSEIEAKQLFFVLSKLRKVFDKIACYLAPDIKSSDLEVIDTIYGDLNNIMKEQRYAKK